MGVWTSTSFQELTPDKRLDAEFYNHPGFRLDRTLRKAGIPFEKAFTRVVHPGEFPRGYQDTPGKLFLRAQNVRTAHVEVTEPLYVSETVFNSLPNAQTHTNELLLVRTGANHGDLARVPADLDGVMVSSHTLRLIPRPETPVYALEFFFASSSGRNLLLSLRSGGTHGQINANALKTLHLPDFRSLEPQMKAIGERIETKRRQAKVLYADAEAALNSALGLDRLDLALPLCYEDRFSRLASDGRFDAEHFQPKFAALLGALRKTGLELVRLGEIINPVKNGFDYRDFCEEGTPYIRVGDVKQGRIEVGSCARIPPKAEDLPKDVSLTIGDVLFTRKGSFGNAAHILPGQEHAIISSEIMLIRRKPAFLETILPEYLALYFNSKAGTLQAEKWAHGVAFYSISQEDLARFVIPVLPMSKQEDLKAKMADAEAADQESRYLLEMAKRAVEIAIEDGETTARKFLDKEEDKANGRKTRPKRNSQL